MSSYYGRYNGGNFASQKNHNNEQPLRIVITAAIINIIVAAVMIAVSFLMIHSQETREIFIKVVFLPTTAFVGSFIALFFYKKLILNIIGGAAVWLFCFLLFVDFSAWVITWLIFYSVNALLGSMAAFVARTFR